MKLYLNEGVIGAGRATFDGRLFGDVLASVAQEVDERVEDVSDMFHGGNVDDRKRVGVLGVVPAHQRQGVVQKVATVGGRVGD